MTNKPFTAYSGDEPFIFASYSHNDDELVYPELERLKELGYNVWYDEGIQAGSQWTDQLAQRLNDCALAVYFITPNSVLSRHCGNEVHYALDLEKPILVIHLKPATLPPGQRLQLGGIQGILRHELSEAEYVAKLQQGLRELMPAAPARVHDAGAQPSLPMGVVTFLHLDIVGSHGLAQSLGESFSNVVLRLRGIVSRISRDRGGHEIEMRGDACFTVFARAAEAVRAAVEIQRACAVEEWPGGHAVSVRMGLHTGQPTLAERHYYGVDVQRVLHIADIASADQILLSAITRDALADEDLDDGIVVRDLGSHRLRDIPYPEILFDLDIPGLNDDFAPIASLTNRPSNLPTALSSFVGRRTELEEIRVAIQRPDTRILTLTGPGGTGKTRLSIEAARSLSIAFPNGVYLVKLAAINDPALIIPTIAETMGVKEMAGVTPMQSLVKKLADKRTLLVIDNFEQVVAGATELLHLVHECSGVRIIVSSREPLHLQLEREYPVEPLALPARDPALRKTPLAEVESVRLFVERVQEFKPSFQLTVENQEAVAGICLKLDGLPLALELAAARMSVLTPAALLDNLDRSLKVLKSRSRDLPDRQRTLHSTVSWSYNLLEAEEKEVFRRLSTFRGGFGLEAAQLVLQELHDSFDLLDIVDSLVRKSLLKFSDRGIEPRYWMLETIRQFGEQELLADPEESNLRDRHARFFVDYAESLAPGLTGWQQRQCVTSLLGDSDNLRASMEHLLATRDASGLTSLFKSLWWLWIPLGRFTEGWDWVKRAQETFSDLADSREKALIGETSAWLAMLSGDYPAALPDLESCYLLYQDHGTPIDLARIQICLCVTRSVMQVDGAEELGSAALASLAELDDPYLHALAYIAKGVNRLMKGEFPDAAVALQEALRRFREIGNSYWPGHQLQSLALFHLGDGDWEGAVPLLLEALDLAREFDYPMINNMAISAMGGVAVVRGQPTEAARLFGAVRASLDRIGVGFEPPEQEAMDTFSKLALDQLGESTYQEAFHEGFLLCEEEARAAARAVAQPAPA